MKTFAGRLSETEVAAVAAFVDNRFVKCAASNTEYHTPENGWPDHRNRYRAALPFALGEIAIDMPEELLGDEERAGLAMFRSSCATCHFGRLGKQAPFGLFDERVAAGEGASAHDGTEHVDDYETPTVHDIPPMLVDATDAERRGAALYESACAVCHASDGSGKNWIGKFLRPHPTDFTTTQFAAEFDLERFIAQTRDAETGTTMPSFRAVMSNEELAAIAAYVRKVFVEGAKAN